LVDAKDQESFDNDTSVDPPGSVEFKKHFQYLIEHELFESAQRDLEETLESAQNVFELLLKKQDLYLDELIPTNIPKTALDNLTEEHKNMLLIHQYNKRINKLKEIANNGHKSLVKEINILKKLEINDVYEVIVNMFNTIIGSIISKKNETSGETLKNTILEDDNGDMFSLTLEAELKFRRKERNNKYKILEKATEQYAESLYNELIMKRLKPILLKAFSSSEEKFNEQFFNNRVGLLSFKASLHTLIMLRARYLLEYFVLFSRKSFDERDFTALKNCKVVLQGMGIDMKVNEHPDDARYFQFFAGKAVQNPTSIPSSVNPLKVSPIQVPTYLPSTVEKTPQAKEIKKDDVAHSDGKAEVNPQNVSTNPDTVPEEPRTEIVNSPEQQEKQEKKIETPSNRSSMPSPSRRNLF